MFIQGRFERKETNLMHFKWGGPFVKLKRDTIIYEQHKLIDGFTFY